MSEHVYLADLVGLGEQVDILPYAAAVAAECPYDHDLSPLELAELTALAAKGKYIKVDVQDRVAGRMLGSMTRQVIGRVVFEHHRKAQLLDPGLRSLRPHVELLADLDICDHAAAKTGRFLDDSELEPVPLPQCWGDACHCNYATKKSGASPDPQAEATFSGLVEIEDDDDEDDDD